MVQNGSKIQRFLHYVNIYVRLVSWGVVLNNMMLNVLSKKDDCGEKCLEKKFRKTSLQVDKKTINSLRVAQLVLWQMALYIKLCVRGHDG